MDWSNNDLDIREGDQEDIVKELKELNCTVIFHRNPIPEEVTNVSLVNRETEAALAGRIENDVFFRVLAVNNFSSARVEACDLRTGLRLASFALAARLSDAAEPNSYRPEISYSPARNTLYIVSVQFGELWAINMSTGSHQKIALPTVNFGVRDIEMPSPINPKRTGLIFGCVSACLSLTRMTSLSFILYKSVN